MRKIISTETCDQCEGCGRWTSDKTGKSQFCFTCDGTGEVHEYEESLTAWQEEVEREWKEYDGCGA